MGEGRGFPYASVACSWAGAVMQKLLAKLKCYRPTDQQTDQPTDTAAYRVACTQLKIRPQIMVKSSLKGKRGGGDCCCHM